MSTQPKSIRKVLFVEDDASFLDMIENVFSGWSKGAWQFLRAENAGKAMAMMEDQLVDLVVIDLHLPGLDGLQFLHLLHRRYANIPKAVMTGFATPESKAECMKSGADVYLQKPLSIEEMQSVFATLNELSKWRSEANTGFRGVMRQISLSELIQMECLNKNSSVLEVSSGTRRGQVFIREGRIVHAQAPGHKGQNALNYFLSLKGGEFNLKPFFEPPETTIEGSWEGLLMEAAQAADEADPIDLHPPELEEHPPLAEAALVLPEHPVEARVVQPPLVQETPVYHAPLRRQNLPAPRIEEMLVCSARNDVLYEWQCQEPDTRLDFMESLRLSTQELAGALGVFDRLECVTEQHSILVRLTPDSQIFLHTSLSGKAVASP